MSKASTYHSVQISGAGSVNVITRRSDSVGRSVTLGGGSAGLVRGQASAGGRDEAGRHWLISASLESSSGEDRFFPQWQGIDGSDGVARNLDGERLRRLFLRGGGDGWSAHLAHGRREKDAAGALYGTDFAAPATNIDVTTQIGLRFQRPLNTVWTLETQAYAHEYIWKGLYRYSGEWETDSGAATTLGGSVQLTGQPWKNQTWVMGASIRDDIEVEQENIGGRVDSSRRAIGLYAQDDIRFNDTFTLNLGGRYDHYTQGSRQFSPRGALIVNLPQASVLKLMAGKAFRPPNAYEQYYSYPDTQVAGGDLKPERITTTEIALEQPIGPNGRWSASVFRNQFSDLIGLTTDLASGLQQYKNIGDARTEGLELGGRYRFAGGVDVRGSLAWQSSEDATGQPLPNSPRRVAKVLAIISLGSYEFGWESYYTGQRNDAFGARIGGQAVSHAALSGHFSRDLRWQLRVSNVFDRQFSSVVGLEYSLGEAGSVPSISDYGRQVQFQLTTDF